jgi:hypothetical protein
MIGLNCLDPGQAQKVHAHDGADKFYFVLEGHGKFTVGRGRERRRDGSAGGGAVRNSARRRQRERRSLTLLVTICPAFQMNDKDQSSGIRKPGSSLDISENGDA